MSTPAPPSAPANPWFDSPRRYGRISRMLHWGMALLMGWQFTGMVLKVTLDLNPRESFMVGTHNSVGIVLLVLVLLRGLWALLNLRRRPPHEATLLGRAAMLGHVGLYGLMVLVPTLALLRLIGSGRPFSLFGVVPLFDASERVDWMMAPANAAHGVLGWILLALIAGHIGMVIVHHFLWKDDTLHRMAGPRLK